MPIDGQGKRIPDHLWIVLLAFDFVKGQPLRSGMKKGKETFKVLLRRRRAIQNQEQRAPSIGTETFRANVEGVAANCKGR
jgi:hypothetical protein